MKHAILGASSSYRWKACPGSVRLIGLLPDALREESSPYAKEGNAAHNVAEWCLRMQEPARTLRGQWAHPEGPIGNRKLDADWWRITDEMVEAVQLYLDTIWEHKSRLQGAQLLIESSVKPLAERDDMFGTADAILIEPFGKLEVFDFKYGRGHVVEVEFNDQALFYALGALELVGDDSSVSDVTIGIVQPRAYHEDGAVRLWTPDVAQVRAEADQLRSAARATEDPSAPLIPGEAQCRFCPAAGRCPALKQLALSVAADDFPDDLDSTPTLMLPDPTDPEQLAKALRFAEMIEVWPREVRKMAYYAAQAGTEIPGYKLVRGVKRRVWKDEEQVLFDLKNLNTLPGDYLSTPELKSPKQLEAVMGKDWVAERAIKPEGELTLVPDTDKRQAALPALVADFPDDLKDY